MATQQLFGRADSSLVKAAYEAELANVPKDLAPMHARMAASYKVSMDSTAELWKSVIKATEKVATSLKEQAKLNKLGSEETLSWGVDGVIDNNFSYTDINGNTEEVRAGNHEELLRELRKERASLSWLGGSMETDQQVKKARRKELKEIQDNIRASTKGFLVFREKGQAMIDSDSYNTTATRGNRQLFLQALMANGKPLVGGQRAVMGWTEKGIMTFGFVDKDGKSIEDEFGNVMTMQQGDVDSYLTPKYEDGRTAIGGAILGAAKDGAKGLPRNPTVLNNLVKNTISTPAQFSDLSNWTGANMEATLADKLHGIKFDEFTGEAVNDETGLSQFIFSNLDVTRWDTIPEDETEGDGVIDGRDFATQGNYEKLISALLNPKNPDFDLGLSKQILAKHFGESADDLHGPELGRYNRNKNIIVNGGDKNTFEMFGKTFPEASTVAERSEKATVEAIIEGRSRIKVNGTMYLRDGDKYKLLDPTAEFKDARWTKTELSQEASTIYGAPDDWDWSKKVKSKEEKTTFVVGQVYELKGKKYEYLESGEFKEITETQDNPITDYEKRGDAWYYIKGEGPGKGTYVSPKEYPTLEAKKKASKK